MASVPRRPRMGSVGNERAGDADDAEGDVLSYVHGVRCVKKGGVGLTLR